MRGERNRERVARFVCIHFHSIGITMPFAGEIYVRLTMVIVTIIVAYGRRTIMVIHDERHELKFNREWRKFDGIEDQI